MSITESVINYYQLYTKDPTLKIFVLLFLFEDSTYSDILQSREMSRYLYKI